jgi:hypothetical protein
MSSEAYPSHVMSRSSSPANDRLGDATPIAVAAAPTPTAADAPTMNFLRVTRMVASLRLSG